jgi:hypothetical protein
MSVHPDRGAWVVRWRDNGAQRARRFKTEGEAIAFDEGLSGGSGAPRSSTPNVYPYETSDGLRWRYSYRDSRGRLSTRRGFLSERAAARDREERMGRVRQGTVVVSRATFGDFFPEWLRGRRPYLTAGTWADYEVHGRKRLLPHFGSSRLTAITTFEVRDWLLELHEAGEYAPKTLNNALAVLVAALNVGPARADRERAGEPPALPGLPPGRGAARLRPRCERPAVRRRAPPCQRGVKPRASARSAARGCRTGRSPARRPRGGSGRLCRPRGAAAASGSFSSGSTSS